MNITKGKRQTAWEQMYEYAYVYPDTARRIYDRLRKRSYRRTKRIDYVVHGSIGITEWTGYDHEAYVAGVRDALNEVLYG